MKNIPEFDSFVNESFHMPDGTPIGVDRLHRPITVNENSVFSEFMLEWQILGKESNTIISKNLKELIDYVSTNNIKKYTIKGRRNNKWENLIS